MSNDWIIGTLAFVTIGIVLLLALGYFAGFLRKKSNRDAAYNAALGDESVTTRQQREAPAGSFESRPIRERLD